MPLHVIRELFYHSSYNEVILSIVINGRPYSMPLGLRYINGDLYARIFPETLLYSSLLHDRSLESSACITCDPLLFYRAVLRKDELEYSFEHGFPCIKGCDGCVYGRLITVDTVGEIIKAIFKPMRLLVLKPYPHPFMRGASAIVEALVHYTRIPVVGEEDAQRLLGFIEAARYAVERSTDNPELRKAMRDIYRRALEAYEKHYR